MKNKSKHYQIYRTSAFACLLVLAGMFPVTADVLMTKDGMILNGKVIKRDKKTTVFSNYYGTFKIDNTKIKDFYETRKAEEDIKLMKKMGKEVNLKDAKRNFQTGIEKKIKIEKKEEEKSPGNASKHFHVELALTSFFMFNMADLRSALPWSLGGAFTADFYFLKRLSTEKNIFIPELEVEFSYLYADKGHKNLNGFGLTAGPLWFYQIGSRDRSPRITVALLLGGGNYHVENSDTEARRFSFNTVALAGVSFPLGPVCISPGLRYSYIYDRVAPLHSAGIYLNFSMQVL